MTLTLGKKCCNNHLRTLESIQLVMDSCGCPRSQEAEQQGARQQRCKQKCSSASMKLSFTAKNCLLVYSFKTGS